LEDKGKRFYLCPPKPKGMGMLVRLWIFGRGLKKKKKFFFEKACGNKKKLYFCTRFENER
jgi:hypothetical protein